MEAKKVLLVGQNPETYSGNGNMLAKCLEEIDHDKNQVTLFIHGETPIELMDPHTAHELPVISSFAEQDGDPWGKRKLLEILNVHNFDEVVFVGLDIWRYADIFDYIQKIKYHKNFVWKVLVPYDLDHIREDWVRWLNYPDRTYIYSYEGYCCVEDRLKNGRYFLPDLPYKENFQPPTEDEYWDVRSKLFPDISDDCTVFFYSGNNQIRKNIFNMLLGFSILARYRKDWIVYLHMNDVDNPFSIERLVKDFGMKDMAMIRYNKDVRRLRPEDMALVMKGMDCHVLTSLQEGLSWTVVETKKMGIPSVLSATTAHMDYMYFMDADFYDSMKKYGIFYVESDETTYLPLMTEYGVGYVWAQSCSPAYIASGLDSYLMEKDNKNIPAIRSGAQKVYEHWQQIRSQGGHSFNDLLEDEVNITTEQVEGEEL
jgi:hypothetical protein